MDGHKWKYLRKYIFSNASQYGCPKMFSLIQHITCVIFWLRIWHENDKIDLLVSLFDTRVAFRLQKLKEYLLFNDLLYVKQIFSMIYMFLDTLQCTWHLISSFFTVLPKWVLEKVLLKSSWCTSTREAKHNPYRKIRKQTSNNKTHSLIMTGKNQQNPPPRARISSNP